MAALKIKGDVSTLILSTLGTIMFNDLTEQPAKTSWLPCLPSLPTLHKNSHKPHSGGVDRLQIGLKEHWK